MTQRDRLIELVRDATDMHMGLVDCVPFEEYVADQLLSNGVIVPPVKVGDTVWKISRAYKTVLMYTVAGYLHDGMRWKMRLVKTIPSWVGNKTEQIYVAFGSFGKTVFLTREEALKEG